MNDRPTSDELLSAARNFLETELIPALSDTRLKFQTLVTANVLAIVEREIRTGDSHLRAEFAELSELLGDSGPAPDSTNALRQFVCDANRRLCELIRRGDYDERAEFLPLLKVVRSAVVRKLEVANPRYLEVSNERA